MLIFESAWKVAEGTFICVCHCKIDLTKAKDYLIFLFMIHVDKQFTKANLYATNTFTLIKNTK